MSAEYQQLTCTRLPVFPNHHCSSSVVRNVTAPRFVYVVRGKIVLYVKRAQSADYYFQSDHNGKWHAEFVEESANV